MKKLFLMATFLMALCFAQGQVLTAETFLTTLSMPVAKIENWAEKKNFYLSESRDNGDTTVKKYNFRPTFKKDKPVDSVSRSIVLNENNGACSICYQTSFLTEVIGLEDQLKDMGFYCAGDSGNYSKPLLYQHQNKFVMVSETVKDGAKIYSVVFDKKEFPDPKDIEYAEDLAGFDSHEQLSYYFGEENVKADIYYLAENKTAVCTVLFIGTKRQVVFIWEDDLNRCKTANVLFGGQQKLKSLMGTDNFIAENNWMFKSGVHAGMTLYELRTLNEDDIKFYGGKSGQPGWVVPDNSGKLDFKKEAVILGCMNCNDNNFATATYLNADEAMTDGRILFVLAVVLNPNPDKGSQSESATHTLVNN